MSGAHYFRPIEPSLGADQRAPQGHSITLLLGAHIRASPLMRRSRWRARNLFYTSRPTDVPL